MSGIQVYVGNYGTYKIADDILARALAANGAMKLNDRRTRGGKMIEAWGRAQDAAAQQRASQGTP